MADDKPFEASASRLAKAKREGDVPRSADLVAAASHGCAWFATFALLGAFAAAARRALEDAARPAFSPWPYLALATCAVAVPVAGLAASLVATYAQTQTVSFTVPSPKFHKLNPLDGLKRMFSRDALVGGAKALVVALAVTAAAIPAARGAFAAGVASAPAALADVVAHAVQGLVGSAVAVAALFAVADVFLERAKWKRRLKMSFDELKRDHKQTEGDPLLRGRRRQAHRALVRGSIGRVKDAAFVVTNPTHVAIALAYRPPEIAVPHVLVRAIDAGAREVKRRARELRIPIVENVALARALLDASDVGEPIPPGAYGAVAAIVASLAHARAVA